MPMRHEVYTYDDELMGFFPVASRADVEASRYADIDPNYSTASAGAIRALVKIFAPGFFAATIPGSAKDRLLPRTYAAAALAAGATSLTVKANTSGIFVVGDVISVIAPNARVNVQSATTGWAIGDTITVTVNSVPIVYTIVGADIAGGLPATNQLVADKVITAVKNNPYLRNKVNGLSVAGASGSVDIVFWALDFSSLYALAVADTGANGTASATNAVFAPNTTVGSVSAVNTSTNVLTISAAAVSVPNGLPIGNALHSPVGQGLLSPNQPIDLLYRESTNFALYTEAYLYGKRMPYWDGEIAAAFPGLILTNS
jgi:hypothetical protein